MPWLLNRVSFSAAIIAVSILVHLGFVGAIVLAERRVLPPSDLRAIDVDLVKPEDIEPKKDEPPEPPEPPKQALPKPPQIAKSEVPLSKPDTKPAPEQLDTPSPEEKRAARPDTPQGGPAGEVGVHDFEGDGTAEVHVPGPIDDAHAPFAEEGFDLILLYFSSN